MSRSGYVDDYDCDDYPLALYRGAVTSAMTGKRGQAFLREVLAALDAMPVKRLIRNAIVLDDEHYHDEPLAAVGDFFILESGEACLKGEVCAMGAVVKARGVDMRRVDPEDADVVADKLGINDKIVREIAYMNDESGPYNETPEERYERMRTWVARQIWEWREVD
jgi:(2Fe-2S) ferredoxin